MKGDISYIAKSHSKQIINTGNVIIILKKVNTLHILMQTIYMA